MDLEIIKPRDIRSYRFKSLSYDEFMIYRAIQYLVSNNNPALHKVLSLVHIQNWLAKQKHYVKIDHIKYVLKKLVKYGLIERKIYWYKDKNNYLIKQSAYRFCYFA